MFIWVTLLGVDTARLAEKALAYDVAIVPGGVFYGADRGRGTEQVRLNFTHSSALLLKQGVKRLSEVLSVL
ncbi:MAG: hypothetical protein JKY66_06550 [Spongiibacteraceae bacterium]|nr:hypothetical protein [Spongiibacteraceae bacterium]MBN4055302.1 hypothetical protein [bacterium AH-315-K03]